MNEENITPETLPGDAHVTASDAEGTVGSEPKGSAPIGLTLEELNRQLGKQFPTKEAALKSIADTFSYVGKKTGDIEKEVLARVKNDNETASLSKQLEEMRKDLFYTNNPQYAKPEIRTLIDKLGGNPSEVTNSPEFKSVFEKVQGFEETQSRKTVLDSNPRLAASKDSLTKATELRQKGGSSQDVEALVVDAVLGLLDK